MYALGTDCRPEDAGRKLGLMKRVRQRLHPLLNVATLQRVAAAGVVSQIVVLVVVVVVPLAVAFRRKLSSSLSHNALHANPPKERERERRRRSWTRDVGSLTPHLQVTFGPPCPTHTLLLRACLEAYRTICNIYDNNSNDCTQSLTRSRSLIPVSFLISLCCTLTRTLFQQQRDATCLVYVYLDMSDKSWIRFGIFQLFLCVGKYIFLTPTSLFDYRISSTHCMCIYFISSLFVMRFHLKFLTRQHLIITKHFHVIDVEG